MVILAFQPNKFFFITLFLTLLLFCYSEVGYADYDPAQIAQNAFICFSDKFIYTNCDEEYRLNQCGNLNIPYSATNEFCNGPCLAETQHVLNCVDSILSNFHFYNKATTHDVRNALSTGCSDTTERGNFDVREYVEAVYGSGHRINNLFSLVLPSSAVFFLVSSVGVTFELQTYNSSHCSNSASPFLSSPQNFAEVPIDYVVNE
ncbi:hypothetical protein RJ641_023736 [Dillenia turbinata]|uniref:DUF7731 domain-containing protein n=1 Tax=Dillenia turbinata TaxID=194707 RepID=A0AAN8YVX9_9MAGN